MSQVTLTAINFDSCQILQLEDFLFASWVLHFCPLLNAFIDYFTMWRNILPFHCLSKKHPSFTLCRRHNWPKYVKGDNLCWQTEEFPKLLKVKKYPIFSQINFQDCLGKPCGFCFWFFFLLPKLSYRCYTVFGNMDSLSQIIVIETELRNRQFGNTFLCISNENECR